NVMIGSDFDGLTDPPNDVVDSSQFGNLTRYLIKKGLSDDIIKKILGGNAQRILEKGWKKN
ncbi:MAG: membrane dipeptidase, partial [Spirochaetes bacterium]|nr:membrane dipeptidase [Spirochaetota bacterium]